MKTKGRVRCGRTTGTPHATTLTHDSKATRKAKEKARAKAKEKEEAREDPRELLPHSRDLQTTARSTARTTTSTTTAQEAASEHTFAQYATQHTHTTSSTEPISHQQQLYQGTPYQHHDRNHTASPGHSDSQPHRDHLHLTGDCHAT